MEDKKIGEIFSYLDFYVQNVFGLRVQVEDPEQAEFIEEAYGARFKPIVDYEILKKRILRDPSPENQGILKHLHENAGIGGGDQIEFLNLLKKYVK